MDAKQQLEPGLLKTYRLLVWVLVGISVFQSISMILRIGFGDLTIHPIWIFPLGNLLILGLLYWPWARKNTGKFFVPILVTLATVGGILRTYLISMVRIAPDVTISILVEGPLTRTFPFELYEFSLVVASWQLIPLLFIPLMMVAWQYNFKAVIGFVAASTLLEMGIFMTILNSGDRFVAIFSVSGILLIRTITFLVVGFLVSRMMAAQRQQQRELRQANQQLLGYTMTLEQLTTTRERNRLARELHDTLAHTLSGLAVQLGAIKALWERDTPEAKEKLDIAIQSTRQGLEETRRALQSLRAAPLEDLGLNLAIRDLAKTAAARGGFSLSMETDKLPGEIPPNISQAFYRAAQEALENIVQHAQAQNVTLILRYTEKQLILQITDDGVGFDPNQIDPHDYGLRGLQERAALIDGQCLIESQPGRGTTIIFSTGVTQL